MAILQKKQRARPSTPDRQVLHHGLHRTERAVAYANTDICTLAKWVRFRDLNPDLHVGW